MALNVSAVKDKSTQLLARLTHLTMRKKIVVGSVTAAIILGAGGAVFLAAQPDAILVSGGSITNLPALLKQAEGIHAAGNTGLRTLSASGEDKGTDCFVVMVEKSVQEQISCGAVLHASAKVGTFDSIGVEWSKNKDGSYTGKLTGGFQPYAGALVVDGTDLRRPDGIKPVNPEDLTSKSATQTLTEELLPADGFGLLEGLTAKNLNLGDPVKVLVPNGAVNVAVGSTEVVTDDTGAEFAAPMGSQFVSFSVAQIGASAADDYATATATAKNAQKMWSDHHNSLTYQMAYGGDSEGRDIWDVEDSRLKVISDSAAASVVAAQQSLLHWNLNIVDSITGEQIDGTQLDKDGVVSTEPYVVLIAPGTAAELTVRVGDTTQTIPLTVGTNGEVTSDNPNTSSVVADLAAKASASFPDGYDVRTSSATEGTINASVTSAKLSVVADGQYAPKGNRFLNLTTETTGICADTAQDIEVTDYMQTKLSTDDGVSLGAPLEVKDETSDSVELVWSVPSEATSFDLLLRPTASCVGKYMMSTETFDYQWAAPESAVGTVAIDFASDASTDTATTPATTEAHVSND